MLAGEPCLIGVRPLVLERQPRLRETPKANGFNEQIMELLRYRGLLDRGQSGQWPTHRPGSCGPFGSMHLDSSHLADRPIWAAHLPQPRLERLLGEHACELRAGIRCGHKVAGVSQNDATVAADVRSPEGPYRVTARYLAGAANWTPARRSARRGPSG
jgi:2-polyprenyl-6-methoxyphenol hydroxylase-like FAD-dependent oxidoreductase